MLVQYSEKDTKIIDVSKINSKELTVLFSDSVNGFRVTIKIPNLYLDGWGYYYGGASNGTDNLYAVILFNNKRLRYVSFTKQGQELINGSMRVLY